MPKKGMSNDFMAGLSFAAYAIRQAATDLPPEATMCCRNRVAIFAETMAQRLENHAGYQAPRRQQVTAVIEAVLCLPHGEVQIGSRRYSKDWMTWPELQNQVRVAQQFVVREPPGPDRLVAWPDWRVHAFRAGWFDPRGPQVPLGRNPR